METNNIKCPSCGAELTYDPGGTSLTCEYCGAKVQLTNDPEILKLKQEQERWRAEQKEKENRLNAKLKEAEDKYVKSAAFRMKLIIVSTIIFFIGFVAIRRYPDNPVFKIMMAIAFVVAIFSYLELSHRRKKLERMRRSYMSENEQESSES